MKHCLALVLLLVGACAATAPEDLAPSQVPVPGKGDGQCPGVAAAIAPTALSQYSCGPLDAPNDSLAGDVNAFWASQVQFCACGPDFPSGCDGAFSTFHHGYVYAGLSFMNDLIGSSQSAMVGSYVYAHEFGHELEGHYDAYAPTTLQRELTADCLAGYYLGSLICKGEVTTRDLQTTLATACVIADGTGDPVADLESHGTCDQRVKSVAAGIDAYLAGQAPLAACAL